MKQTGFTFIELMVSLLIISVLASLVVPDLRNIRRRTFDVSAQNFIRIVATKLEDYYFEHLRYFSCQNQECNTFLRPLTVPTEIELVVRGDASGYQISGRHHRGSGKTFVFDSERGGFVMD